MGVDKTELPLRDFKMDAGWLRDVADDSDDAAPDGEQRLWPETRANLRDIAAYVERLAEQPIDAPATDAEIASADPRPFGSDEHGYFYAGVRWRESLRRTSQAQDGSNPCEDGRGCYHGKVFIESDLSMAPCPKCSKNVCADCNEPFVFGLQAVAIEHGKFVCRKCWSIRNG